MNQQYNNVMNLLARREGHRSAAVGRDPYQGPGAEDFAAEQIHACMTDGEKGTVRVESWHIVGEDGARQTRWAVYVYRKGEKTIFFQHEDRDLRRVVDVACRRVSCPEFVVT